MAYLLLIVEAAMFGASPDASFERSITLLRRELDFSRADLSDVQYAFEPGDQLAAAQAVLDHFRRRGPQPFYFSREDIGTITDAIERKMPKDMGATIARADKVAASIFSSTCAPTTVAWIPLPDDFQWTGLPRGGPTLSTR